MKSVSYIYDKTIVLLLKQLSRAFAYLVPRRRDLVVLGAWCGDRYADGPKFLAEYLLEKSELNLVWIGKPAVRESLPQHRRLSFAEMGSWAAFWALLRAKTWVCCISIEWDLTTWPIEGSARIFNTWHGFGIKRDGNDTKEARQRQGKASLAGRIVRFLELHKCPWGLVGGEQDVGQLLRVCKGYFRADQMLRVGTPPDDYLLNHKHDADLIRLIRGKYEKLLGIGADKKIVTYLPTWRNSGVKVFSFYGLPEEKQEKWRQMLAEQNAVIVEKHHPRTLMEFPMVGESRCSIPISLGMQKKIEVYELLLVTDILISDCSGAYKDFGVLKRPCIHFMYDLDDYADNCSGLVEGWRDMLAGPLVLDEPTLVDVVRSGLQNPRYEPAFGYEKTVEYQKGKACESVLKMIEG